MQLSLNIVCFSKMIPFSKVVEALKDPMSQFLKGMGFNSKGMQ